MNKPSITLITIVFNGQKHIEKTIQAVIKQGYEPLEYIIIDGGSTDGTLDIIRKYENHISYWKSEPDKGINGADPFVIGVAAVQAHPWVVVSGEKPGSVENPKIPWVCRQYRPVPIRHMSFLEMILEEGWEL